MIRTSQPRSRFRLPGIQTGLLILAVILYAGCQVIDPGDSTPDTTEDSPGAQDAAWTSIIDSLDLEYDYAWSVYTKNGLSHIFGREPEGGSVIYSESNAWKPVKPGIRIAAMAEGQALYGFRSNAYNPEDVGAVYSTDGGAIYKPLFTGYSVLSLVPGNGEVDYLFVSGNGSIHRVYTLGVDSSAGQITPEAQGPESFSDISQYALLVPDQDPAAEAVIAADTDGRLWVVTNQGADVAVLTGPTSDEGPLIIDQYGKTLHLLNGGKLYRVALAEVLGAEDATALADLPSFEGHSSNAQFSNIDRLDLMDTEAGSVIIARSSWLTTGFFSAATSDGLTYADSPQIGESHGFNGSCSTGGSYYVFGRDLFSSPDGVTWTNRGYHAYQGGGTDTAWITALGIHNSQLYVSVSTSDTDEHGSHYPRIDKYQNESWSFLEGVHQTDGSERAGAVMTPGGRLFIHSDAPSLDGGVFTINDRGESTEVLDGMVRNLHVSGDSLFASLYYRPETGTTTASYRMFRYNLE